MIETHHIPGRTKCSRLVRMAPLAAVTIVADIALWEAAAIFRAAWLVLAAAAFSALVLLAVAWLVRKVVVWKAHRWLGPYLLTRRVRLRRDRPLDVCFQFIDHFEPDYGRADPQQQLHRVEQWEQAYGSAIEDHADSDGRRPQHTWFFAVSENDPRVAESISAWCGRGWGEIEYHLHHDRDLTADALRERIAQDVARLRQLGAAPQGRYAFVHGMFALAAGDPQYCRITDEIDVLLETGCYGDFTFGSIGAPGQPRQVNSIYYARTTGRPKPYDTGRVCTVGRPGDGLMMIPGPMCFGLFPRGLDDAHVEPNHLPRPRRIRRWLDAHVHVRGRPNWVFIGAHSHTARDDARRALFSGPMQRLWSALERRFASPQRRLHYLTAREAYNVAKAAEAGRDGDPDDYRDFEVPPPENRAAGVRPKPRSAPPEADAP